MRFLNKASFFMICFMICGGAAFALPAAAASPSEEEAYDSPQRCHACGQPLQTAAPVKEEDLSGFSDKELSDDVMAAIIIAGGAVGAGIGIWWGIETPLHTSSLPANLIKTAAQTGIGGFLGASAAVGGLFLAAGAETCREIFKTRRQKLKNGGGA